MINYNASPPTAVLNFALSSVPPASDWICYTQSENHYVMIFEDTSSEWQRFDIVREYTQGSGYTYNISELISADEPSLPSQPMYCYSSVGGYGTYITNPRSTDSQSFSIGFIAVAIVCVLIFGGLFRK